MRREIRRLLAAGDVDEVAQLAESRKRVLGDLVSLTYDRDPDIAERAVTAMGLAGARVADHDPAAVREHLRRLLWLLSEESGGICWRAPEAMAEIVRLRPELFADYVPIVMHLLLEMAEEDLGHFRVGILRAIGLLGPVGTPYLEDVLPAMTAALDHPDPAVRDMAAWALGRVGRGDLVASGVGETG